MENFEGCLSFLDSRRPFVPAQSQTNTLANVGMLQTLCRVLSGEYVAQTVDNLKQEIGL